MRRAAQAFGIVWMAICFLAWLWLGLALPLPRPDISPWLMPSLIHETQYGLTWVPIVAGFAGGLIWRWGRSEARKGPEL